MKRTRFVLLAMLLPALAAGVAAAGDHPSYSARSGLDIAHDAALSWASDAQLIYVENDEPVTATGDASRWGYLFYSDRKGKARGYTVREGKILEASDLGFDFEAPPVSNDWVDSRQAFAAAEKKAGEKYRREHGGSLNTMILIRGAFHDKEPNATTWGLLYTSETEPALVVIVDAANGKVVRTWRG